MKDNWQQPFESGTIMDVIIKPATMLQHNWYKLQDYAENDEYSYMHDALDSVLHRITFMYVPEKEDKGAALNFHLTAREKRDVMASFNNNHNQDAVKKVTELLK
jgi:dsDNA-binding SOS-regulon protein